MWRPGLEPDYGDHYIAGIEPAPEPSLITMRHPLEIQVHASDVHTQNENDSIEKADKKSMPYPTHQDKSCFFETPIKAVFQHCETRFTIFF